MLLPSTTFLLGLVLSELTLSVYSFSPHSHTNNVAKTTTTTLAVSRKGFLTTGTAAVAGVAVANLLDGIVPPVSAASATSTTSKSSSGVYEPMPDSMKGQVVLITGGSTGLGLESAKRLASAGATIVLTARSTTKGAAAVQSVKDYVVGNSNPQQTPNIYSLVLDLDDLASVKAFPATFQKLGLNKIDVLLNNAGVMAIPDRQITKDGYERTFQSNHLGHFVLTAKLFPFLSRDKATVINVSSEAYQIAGKGLELDNLNGENSYGAWTSYGQSKLENILFTQELQRRADSAGNTWLTTVTLHPGAVATDLGRNIVGEAKWNELKTKGPSGFEKIALAAASKLTVTVPEGASTQVFLASGAEGTLKPGAFYENMKEMKKLPKFATDGDKAKALWEKSEELGGVKFDLLGKGK